ncbi:unnamed protein product [Trichobilharzia szidati]|nr:unnamed protein product [Trichobilharzia szidati]
MKGETEQPEIGLRLHQISPQMAFGHTNYVPDEETRNLCIIHPEADLLQPSKCIKYPSITRRIESFDIPEKISNDADFIKEFFEELAGKELFHRNYRRLHWLSGTKPAPRIHGVGILQKLLQTDSRMSRYQVVWKEKITPKVSVNEVLNRYRLVNAFSFCLQPNCGFLKQRSSIEVHCRYLLRELGTQLFFLNDRQYMECLEVQLSENIDQKCELVHEKRVLNEIFKTRQLHKGVCQDLQGHFSLPKNFPVANTCSKKNKKTERLPDDIPLMNETEMSKLASEPISSDAESSSKSSRLNTPPSTTKNYGSTDKLDTSLKFPSPEICVNRLTKRASMTSMYNEAEIMIQPVDFEKRYLRYKLLSWVQ